MAVNDDFKHESLQDCDSICKYLNALCEGFQNGRLLFGTKQRKLELEPNGLLDLSVKAKRKDKKVKLYIKMSWTEGKESKDKDSEPLIISV
ncbi:MAG: amphi-Trp domain-containing protein, partial [Nitrospinae bacterium]|nr:amphi-Trp domain-containing protein [Nitrospinota bacterium]